jgi:hypothetical protein
MRVLLLASLLAAGCDRHPPPAMTSSPPASAASTAPAAPPASAASTTAGTPCGELGCVQFDTAKEAFLEAAYPSTGTTAGPPRVLAIGEAHAQKGATASSAAKRFTEDLLPALTGRASDLLVELMMPPTGCADAAAEVRKKQAPATSRQAETNQNEYVTMGDRARALGIVPDLLRPSCADMDLVRSAGDQAIEASLELIARLCGTQALRLVDRDARSDADTDKAVVVYSGMLHNDLSPPPERAKWSYAPALDARVGGRLVSIDLVVPEFIVDDDTWRSLPWYAHYDRAKLGSRVTLFKLADRSYVLVFAEARP